MNLNVRRLESCVYAWIGTADAWFTKQDDDVDIYRQE